MSNYKLTYFNFGGRAEPIRNALRVGGRPFEDIRIEFKDWPQHKAGTPWGTVPVLEVDGHVIGQSNAILRFVGRRTGLYPTNYPAEEFTMARIDELLDVSEDLGSQVGVTMRLAEDVKLAKRKELLEGPVTSTLAKLDAALAANGGKYFVGNSLTVADLKIWQMLVWFTSGMIDGFPTTILDNRPTLAAFVKTLGEQFAPKK